jgi:predicted nucleic acid-binding protein
LDSAYAIALSAPGDQYPAIAVKLAEELQSTPVAIVTTRTILLEIGNSLSKLRYRAAAVELLTSLESDPSVQIVPLTDDHWDRDLELFRSRPDKEWGTTDCLSFVVMHDFGIRQALTPDDHFAQAGYQTLMGHA